MLWKGGLAAFVLVATEVLTYAVTTQNYDEYDAAKVLQEYGIKNPQHTDRNFVVAGIGKCGFNDIVEDDFSYLGPRGIQVAIVCKDPTKKPEVIFEDRQAHT